MKAFKFYAPVKLLFGAGRTSEISSEMTALGIERVLLVTDLGLVKAGLIDHVMSALTKFEVTLFADVEPNPTDSTIMA